MNLALFDFDGTITTEDTYTRFLFYATPKSRVIWGWCLVLPVIMLYKLSMLKASKTRPILSKVAFVFRKQEAVLARAQHYVDEYIPKVLRQEMIEKIRWHQSEGDRVVLVSASLDVYLRLWCQQQGIELLCSELKVAKGRYCGNYVNGDCSEHNKVNAIKNLLELSDYSTVFAYGDTDEDLPMLAIADVKYYQGQYIEL